MLYTMHFLVLPKQLQQKLGKRVVLHTLNYMWNVKVKFSSPGWMNVYACSAPSVHTYKLLSTLDHCAIGVVKQKERE